jgi:hypothetical protein
MGGAANYFTPGIFEPPFELRAPFFRISAKYRHLTKNYQDALEVKSNISKNFLLDFVKYYYGRCCKLFYTRS